MLTNKWIQAVLCGGIGFGLIIGSVVTAISAAPAQSPALGIMIMIGAALMFISLYKIGNVRGTDGWGGPYAGPRNVDDKFWKEHGDNWIGSE